jgi:hypothetical protein
MAKSHHKKHEKHERHGRADDYDNDMTTGNARKRRSRSEGHTKKRRSHSRKR